MSKHKLHSESLSTEKELFNGWLNRFGDLTEPVPLFEWDEDLTVDFKKYGKNNRGILKRSQEMEQTIFREGTKVIEDWETSDDTYTGLIYLMYWLRDERIVPLYIGKAGKYGTEGETLSDNLGDLQGGSDATEVAKGSFARWGDGHYYHIGDLSAVVFDHEKNQKQKYERWAETLFEDKNTLYRPTYFWAKAWRSDDVGPYHDTGIELEALEKQLIELAAKAYPDELLNTAGT